MQHRLRLASRAQGDRNAKASNTATLRVCPCIFLLNLDFNDDFNRSC
jgi:hypothetical protein